ncbi:hypothetical protein SEUCBS140593_006819 [Sporothrix eucalyptigena]|uniref:CBM21 domain-containing protein n=1 Tax=Sporothrix eucalyptigena TaxID=1812306 RepID=A0ABP0C959_9PEZI
MPYTPPSHRSPASSTASSPESSRRPSFNAVKPASASLSFSPAPALPRSSSYLTRHRRTPSAVTSTSNSSSTSITAAGQPTPQSTSEDLKGMVPVVGHGYDEHSSVRQSPPPITGDRRGMPTGAVISPPDSPPTSDDEAAGTRGRRMENMSELKQLHEAISQLPQQRRESSPNDEPADLGVLVVQPIPPVVTSVSPEGGMRHSFSTSSLDHFRRSTSAGRRVSHMRSATEPSVSHSAGSSVNSDEDNDLEILAKPPMVRKKSGELVRPALRLGSGRRPSSMPGTPTFSKVVHFDSHLEHVRHFLQVDRPLAVSAGSSPVEQYDSESEYPFNGSARRQQRQNGSVPHEWEIILSKFPLETPERKALPVRLERVWLSPDQKFLHGSIAVLNLAFTKSVFCRFTLDYWKTTSEIAAEYSAEIIPRIAPQGHDRFNFTIKLSDLANLESKTMYFCIRYAVDGKEFWDNNNGSNFQLDFKKKLLPTNGKSGLQNGALPRSHRRANSSGAPRPVSMPVSLDDFDDANKVMFDQSVHEYLGESDQPSLRLKSSQSATSIASDNLSSRLAAPSGQAFANRYDFGASLSAAVQAAKDAMTTNKRDGLYMKSGRKFAIVPAPSAAAAVNVAAASANTNQRVIAINTTQQPTTVALPVAALDRDSRQILTESALYGPGDIASKSYDEIVSKYCFYVPKPSLPTKDGATNNNGQSNSAAGELVTHKNVYSPASTATSDGSPVQMGRFNQQSARPRWHGETPSRDSSSSSIQSFGSAASPPASTFVQKSAQPRRGTVFATGSLLDMNNDASSSSSSASASPASPASLVGAFPPFAATPPSDFSYGKDRFLFNNADGHSATAIKG